MPPSFTTLTTMTKMVWWEKPEQPWRLAARASALILISPDRSARRTTVTYTATHSRPAASKPSKCTAWIARLTVKHHLQSKGERVKVRFIGCSLNGFESLMIDHSSTSTVASSRLGLGKHLQYTHQPTRKLFYGRPLPAHWTGALNEL